MSTTPSQKTRSLEDFAEFFVLLRDLGVESVTIGGCAVGAYAHLMGETVLSGDLDLLISSGTLSTITRVSLPPDIKVIKWPQPRSVPVAFIEWRGMEVNLLTRTDGLAPAEVEARLAREFRLRPPAGVTVLVADPFDLLRNKLAVNRAKDQPHIEVLRRFLDEEVVRSFEVETDPRERLAPATRLLAVLADQTLAPELAARLVPLARTAADFRFLAHRVSTSELATSLLERVAEASIKAEVERVIETRRFEGSATRRKSRRRKRT